MKKESTKKKKVVLKPTPSNASMNSLVDGVMLVDKSITAAKIRKTHLAKNGLYDPQTDFLIKRSTVFKNDLLKPIAEYVEQHPAYQWFSRIRGIGKENIAKVLCFIRIKPEAKIVNWCKKCDTEVKSHDATVCPFCNSKKLSTNEVELPFAKTVSALWKYAGYATDDKGKADRREKGKKLPFNMTLKVMCTRLGVSLLKASAMRSEASEYGKFYQQMHKRYTDSFKEIGVAIVNEKDIPKGAEIAHNLRDAKRGQYINKLHVHQMAFRKMMKMFLSHLWEVWRTEEGLPVRPPYSHEYKGHTGLINPWEMVDRPLKKVSSKAA